MPFSQHDNFDVSLHARDDDYDVTVRSTSGEFRGTFAMPFARYEVENFLLRMGTRRGVRRVGPSVSPAVDRDFGRRLFDALFHDEVEQALRESQIRSDSDQRGVRIRLRLRDAPELAALPWEYLYDSSEARPLAISTQTPLVRYVDMGNPVRSLRVAPPLRVLAVMSRPRDVEALDTTREFHDLQVALRTQVAEGRVEVHGLHRATPARLRDQLGKAAFHIVHFMGHGAFDESTGTGMVLLEDEDGAPHPVSGHDLGLVLHDHDDLRMVVLNACEGGRGAHDDPVGGVAQSMVHHDIPAVVGMQAEITDVAATCFSAAFYRHLGRGDPVDVAMSEARMKLLLDGHGAEWGIPILYLRSHDGRIFDLVDDPVPADVDELEARADRLRSEGTAAAKIEAVGLYQRVADLQPGREAVGGKLDALQRDTQLVPDPAREVAPPAAAATPPPAPAVAPPDVAPPDVAPPDVVERPTWSSTPVRTARMLAQATLVLERAAARLGPNGRLAVTGLLRALEEPLAIAVAGRPGVGKSTLVNALVGRRVAATGGAPGAQVVTWYRFGPHARVTVALRDGSVSSRDLPEDELPVRIAAPPAEVDHVDVWLPAASLRRQTLVDTPGLAVERLGARRATERALLGHAIGPGGETVSAAALLYVFRGIAEQDELAFLARQLVTGGALDSTSVNAIGIFSHADGVDDGPWGARDPLQVAHQAARRLAADVPHRAADVVAVSGLMAEAARTGSVGDADAEILGHLAGRPLADVAAWASVEVGGVATDRLEGVADRLGTYVLARGRDEAGAGASTLAAWMERRSGIPALEDTVRRSFLERAAALKVDHALSAVVRIAARDERTDPDVAHDVGAAVERARDHRDLHPLRELEALQQVSGVDPHLHRALLRVSGSGSIPERLGVEVGTGIDEVVDEARRAAARAQEGVALAVDPRAAAAARVLSTSYRLLAEEARSLQAR